MVYCNNFLVMNRAVKLFLRNPIFIFYIHGDNKMDDYLCDFNIKIENIVQYPFHMEDCLRLIYIIKGNVKMVVVSGEWILNENDIEIININEPIKIQGISGNDIVLILTIDSQFAKKHCADIDRYTYNCNCSAFFKSYANSRKQKILKDKLYRICKTYVEGNYDGLKEQLKDIVIFIGGQFNDIKNIFLNYPNNDFHMLRFMGINDYLAGNFNKKITLNEIANNQYLSPQYLSGEFSSKLNRSFHSIVDYYRIIESVKLIIKTDLTITAIFQQCGFSAARYFYRKFKYYMNCTPSEFKKELTSNFIISETYCIKSKEILDRITYVLNEYENQSDDISLLLNPGDFDFTQLPYNIKAAKMLLSKKNTINKNIDTEIRHEAYDSNVFASIILKHLISGMDISGHILIKDTDNDDFLSGQKGIYNNNKIRKPLYWAIKFVSKLGDKVIDIGDNYIVTIKNDNMIVILALNCNTNNIDETIDRFNTKKLYNDININIKFKNMDEQEYIMAIEKVDSENGSLLKYWEQINKPKKVNDYHINLIKQYIRPHISLESKKDMTFKTNFKLEPFSFALVTIVQKG